MRVSRYVQVATVHWLTVATEGKDQTGDPIEWKRYRGMRRRRLDKLEKVQSHESSRPHTLSWCHYLLFYLFYFFYFLFIFIFVRSNSTLFRICTSTLFFPAFLHSFSVLFTVSCSLSWRARVSGLMRTSWGRTLALGCPMPMSYRSERSFWACEE